MPIYEYQCKQCGHRLEVIQKISDKRLRKCPACGKQSLSKLVSAAGFRLKGGGWYETDFKGGKKKNVAGEKSDSGSGGSGGSDSKEGSGGGSDSGSGGGDAKAAAKKSDAATSKSGSQTSSKGAGKSKKD
ncbi:MAG: zinc ribbon domain-containing protein [Pseudomonadota bacterium]